MRYILLVSLAFSQFVNAQVTKSFDYCYVRNGKIYLYSLQANKTVAVSKQTDPYLSPDGTKLAYTINGANGDRQIGMMDVATKQKTILNTNNKNCYGPVWSPDGQAIAYNAFINNIWYICTIGLDNHSPLIITKILNKNSGSFSPVWSDDSKKIIVHNLDTVYIFSKEARLIEKIPVNTFAKQDDVTSFSKFHLMKDESKIIFDCSVNEPGFNEPPGAIFVFDRQTKITKRITPKGYWCSQEFLKDDRIYFTASPKNSTVDNIFSVKLDGSDMKMILKNASDFTAKIK